jgi:hypothetical protein
VLNFDRACFVDDDRVLIGPLCNFVGDAICFHRAPVPQRVARHEGAQLPRLLGPRAHFVCALGNPRFDRGRQQLVHRRDQIVGSIRNVRDKRRVGPQHAADARAVVAHVDERRLA